MFLISSDYERAEWREIVREQQKKCEFPSLSISLLSTRPKNYLFHIKSLFFGVAMVLFAVFNSSFISLSL